MPGRPRLKSVVWERVGTELRVVYDPRDQLLVQDPDGTVAALLELLREGGRTASELAEALCAGRDPVAVADVRTALAQLDECRLVEDGDRFSGLSAAEAQRHFNNLAFFEPFASLARSSADFCHALGDAHVLVLGTGGLNSSTIPHLCGLGTGRLTLIDRDVVEARNFARQYLYRWSEIGMRKAERAAEWVRTFDPAVKVEALDTSIASLDQLAELLDQYRPDAVAVGIDHPDEVDRWVNAACVPRRIPFVGGGIWVTEGIVWSVDPTRSACLQCAVQQASTGSDSAGEVATELAGLRLAATRARTNRSIGPVTGLLGALGAFELLRFLTGFEPPAYAANALLIDFANGCTTRREAWPRDPACSVCGPSADGHRWIPTEGR